VACVLLFLLKIGDSCVANRYQPLPPRYRDEARVRRVFIG